MNPVYTEVLTTRHNHLIDPGLHIWGWEIPVYLFLGGVVAGVMVLLALLEMRRGKRPASAAAQWMPFVAIVLLSLGMGALFLDLDFKAHVFRFYTAFEPDLAHELGRVDPDRRLPGAGAARASARWMARRAKSWASGGCSRPDARPLGWVFRLADRARRGIVWASLALGVGLGAYTGLLLGTMVARLGWNSGVLGPLFLTSGVSTGAALMMLFHLEKEEEHLMLRWDTVAIAIELFLHRRSAVVVRDQRRHRRNRRSQPDGRPVHPVVLVAGGDRRAARAAGDEPAGGARPRSGQRGRSHSGPGRRAGAARGAGRLRAGHRIPHAQAAERKHGPETHAETEGHSRADWNPYVAGIALGLVLLASYVLMGFGLGSSSAAARIGYAAAHAVAPGAIDHNAYMAPYVAGNPFEDWMVFEVIGVLLGGILAAYSGGRSDAPAHAARRGRARASAIASLSRWAVAR